MLAYTIGGCRAATPKAGKSSASSLIWVVNYASIEKQVNEWLSNHFELLITL